MPDIADDIRDMLATLRDLDPNDKVVHNSVLDMLLWTKLPLLLAGVERLNAELDTISRLTSSVPEADRHESASDKVRSALNAVTKRNNALRHDLDCARESYHRARRERDEARHEREEWEALQRELAEARQEAETLRAVVEAARAWRSWWVADRHDPSLNLDLALMRAVDALPSTPEPAEDDCHCDDPCCEVDIGVGIQTCGSYHCPVHGAHTKPSAPEPETAEAADDLLEDFPELANARVTFDPRRNVVAHTYHGLKASEAAGAHPEHDGQTCEEYNAMAEAVGTDGQV